LQATDKGFYNVNRNTYTLNHTYYHQTFIDKYRTWNFQG